MEHQREGAARLYRWDAEIVHPHDANCKASVIACVFGIGVGYALQRYVVPFVAVDLCEW